ncbi:MAG: OFA family MFS transporter [Dysgonamonadaceae bacterium]|jgi:MFS family permease|nr:OFA family MFS transporter [Dysgonamonadaceae bacterium]
MKKKARLVLLACSVFNLTIGVLYTWNMFKLSMTVPIAEGGWGWTSQQAGLPYTIAIIFFSIGVFIGGRLQDKIGPRTVCTAGGILVGLGLILSGLIGASTVGIALCFGVMTGTGIGFGYSSVLPTALKWFHSTRKGTVSGFVTGGFCLAAVYLAPMATMLLNHFSIQHSMILMGVLLLVTSVLIAQLIKNPLADYVPEAPKKIKATGMSFVSRSSNDLTSSEIVRTARFRLMFVIFLINVSIGLMIIGNIASIAYYQAKIYDYGVLTFFLSLMAVMNFFGRLMGGIISDKLGRVNTLFVVMVLQMLNMAAFKYYTTMPHLIFGIVVAGICFGAVLSIFPAFTADLFGLKNHGSNYGLIFLAYGVSGVVAPVIADYFYDTYRSFSIPYMVCAAMLFVALVANFALRRELKQV